MPDRAPNPDLAYRVSAEPRRDYLRITVDGERSTVAAGIAGWIEIAEQVRRHGAQRVLIVSRLKGPIPSPDEQRETLSAVVGKGFEGVRTAFVLEDAMRVSALEHGEMVAREHGQESRVFGSEALAEVWLRHGNSGVA